MPAICCRTAASLASDGFPTVFRFGRVIRFLRMIHSFRSARYKGAKAPFFVAVV